MPNETYVTPEQFEQDQKEFNEVLDDIFDKTDEELQQEEMDKAKKANEASGDATEDLPKPEETKTPEEDPAPEPEADPNPDTGMAQSGTDWKAKAEELEAELKKERQRTGSWDGRIKAANQKVKELEAENESLRSQVEAKATEKASADEQSEQEIMDTFRETFPELTEVVDILERKINKASPAQAKQEPKEDPEPAAEAKPAEQSTDESEHYLKIVKAHPDIDELARSGAMITWINQQPEYIQPYLNSVVSKGTADQVIQTVTEFKSKTGWKSSISGKVDPKKKKLESMLETDSQSAGPKSEGPDKNDFAGAAKEAGL